MNTAQKKKKKKDRKAALETDVISQNTFIVVFTFCNHILSVVDRSHLTPRPDECGQALQKRSACIFIKWLQ